MGGGFAMRAFNASPPYWFAMFAASALGTNLGDFWVDWLYHDRPTSFASLAVICVVSIWADRRYAARSDVAYWVAIVALRAAATNVADYMTHDLALCYVSQRSPSESARSSLPVSPVRIMRGVTHLG